MAVALCAGHRPLWSAPAWSLRTGRSVPRGRFAGPSLDMIRGPARTRVIGL